MSEQKPKGNIDLDDLVNTLLQEKRGDKKELSPKEEPPAAVIEETVAKADVRRSASVQPSDVVAAPILEEIPDRPAEKRRRRRREKMEPLEDQDEWENWGLTPIGHYRATDGEPTPAMPGETTVAEKPTVPKEEPLAEEVTVAVPIEADEIPAVQAIAETVTISIPKEVSKPTDSATRVVPPLTSKESQPKPIPETASAQEGLDEQNHQLPDQLSLEEMVRVEDICPAETAAETEEAVDAEEQFRRSREEKIREFTLDGDEEETNEPEEEVEAEPEEEPVLEDFTQYEDTKAVQLELQYRFRTGTLVAALSTVLEAVVLAMTLLAVFLGRSPLTAVGYLTIQVFALGLMAVLNYNAVGRGIRGISVFRANNDTAPAVTLLVGIGGLLLHFLNMEAPLPMWPALVGLPMIFSGVAKILQLRRVRKGFEFVSYKGDKYAATPVTDEKLLQELSQRISMDGHQAQIACFRSTGFLSDYLHNSAEEDAGDDWSRILMPVFFAASLVSSLLLLALGRLTDFWSWMHVFVFMLSLSTGATGLAIQLCLGSCSRYTLSRGGFLSGWNAVRAFGQLDGVTVDAAELYPDESMLLHGIKTFSGTHIDVAILDAAALSIRSGGPLSRIFRRIIQDKLELLPEVDSLVYEQGMGLSGWVDGRRVLVGNRRLLQNHGVDVPSSDYEARYAKNGRRLVYLSTAGELSAMFVVSYLADETIMQALQKLCRAKVTLMVRSCDPNITVSTLSDDFSLDEYYVDVLSAAAGRMYEQMMTASVETAPAVLASNGHILGTATALCACRLLRKKAKLAMIIQLLSLAIGLIMGVVAAMAGLEGYLLPAIALMLLSTVLSWLLPKLLH